MKTQSNSSFDLKSPILWGGVITLVFILFVGWLAVQDVCTLTETKICQTKFQKFLSSPPNEIGDTLAGLAGSLAFLWIIVTVALQSQELKAQREVLQAQKNELKLNRIESAKMVQAMERQALIFEDELQDRVYNRAKASLEMDVRVFLSTMSSAFIYEDLNEIADKFYHDANKSIDYNMEVLWRLIFNLSASHLVNSNGSFIDCLYAAYDVIQGINEKSSSLSDDQKSRLIAMHTYPMEEFIRDIIITLENSS